MKRLVELVKSRNGNLYMQIRAKSSKNRYSIKKKRVTGAKFLETKENKIVSSSLAMSEWDYTLCPLEFMNIPRTANAYTYSERQEKIDKYSSDHYYIFDFYNIPAKFVDDFFNCFQDSGEFICGSDIRRGNDGEHDGVRHKAFW